MQENDIKRIEIVNQLKSNILKDVDSRTKEIRQDLSKIPIDFVNNSFEDNLCKENSNLLNDFSVYNILINEYFYLMRLREYAMKSDSFMEKYHNGEYILSEKKLKIITDKDFDFVSRFITSLCYNEEDEIFNIGIDKNILDYNSNLMIEDVFSALNPHFFIHEIITAIDEVLYDEKQKKQKDN